MSLTSLIVTQFIAYSNRGVEEPNQNVEQKQYKFAF